jgi:beta-mannosidase
VTAYAPAGGELHGDWAAIEADEDLRRHYPEPDFDDAAWGRLAVPGHWRSSPDFAASDGPVLARRRFEAPTTTDEAGRRRWLTFDGLFYQSDVWLVGSYLGDTEVYFFPHTFEVTAPLAERTEHLLALELTCAPQRDPKAKRNLTGAFQPADHPDHNPGGIWRPVRLHETGPVRILRLRVTCVEATSQLAILTCRAILDAAEATTVELRTHVRDLFDRTEEHALAAGENRVEWRVGIDDPPLWWPAALGVPALVDVAVEARLLDRAEPSDARSFRTGLRKVTLSNWIASVNGERLFLKGASQGPTGLAIAEATPQQVAADVELARTAGLDLLRVHAHVARPELYDAADAAGLLLWQDLPLQEGYARGVRKQAVRQAREAVDLLAHHPSIALWCAHDDPFGDPDSTDHVVRSLALPTWNKTILDSSIRRALEKADRSRPVVAHSGLANGDTHLSLGWHHGDEADLARTVGLWPRLARFVSEFGARAVPDSPVAAAPLPDPEAFERLGLDPADFATADDWRDATQAYQANLLRRYVETLRRLKYRPTGGFCARAFGDDLPGITFSVLDHERRPKLGYDALRAACAPVIVVADRPPATVAPGETMALDVHAVSDRREPLAEVVVAATLTTPGGVEVQHAWSGDVPADSCVRIGTVPVVVPDEPGRLTLDLSLTAGAVRATNRYEAQIARR